MATRLWKNIFIGFIACLFISACDSEPDKEEVPTLKMATSADYAPFEFYRGEEIVGFDIDVAKAIGEKIGYEIEIVDIDFSGLIPALQSSRVDFVMSSINPTPKRNENVDFSKLYNVSGGAFIFLQKDGKIETEDSVLYADKRYGVQQGTVFEEFLHYKKQEHPSMEITALTKIPLLIEELKNGRVDGVLLDLTVAKKVLEHVETSYMLEVQGFGFGEAVAFPKGSALVEPFNEAIDALEMSGELEALRNKWFNEAE